MGRWIVALFLLWGSPAMSQVQGLDHIPIVVRDLDRAAADFSALGFALKPGRPHANGLLNVHAKFRDGTELELITATAPTDELSRRYLDWLKRGEGPALLGLYVPNGTLPPMEGVFFDKHQKSATDRPEHFAHPNGASTLAAVWLAGSPAERLLIERTGGRLIERPSCAPFGTASRMLQFPEGGSMLMPRLSDRPIVGATVTVSSLEPVRRLVPHAIDGCTPDSRWVEAHGLWLEFRVR